MVVVAGANAKEWKPKFFLGFRNWGVEIATAEIELQLMTTPASTFRPSPPRCRRQRGSKEVRGVWFAKWRRRRGVRERERERSSKNGEQPRNFFGN